jgi:GlpG protein
MRLIHTFSDRDQAKKFYAYLASEKLDSLLEQDKTEYHVWLYDEDRLDEAQKLLEKFLHPEFKQDIPIVAEVTAEIVDEVPLSNDPIFLAQMQELKKKMMAKSLYQNLNAKLTRLFIILCTFFLAMNAFQHYALVDPEKKAIIDPFKTTRLEQTFFYDTPYNPQVVSPTLPDEIASDQWLGLYDIILNWPDSKALLDAPLFQEILQGQVWRVFTPCLLHAGILHLLFNMLWLWLLGKQIEERVSKSHYLIMILLIGAFSNTVQYLMSGPNFLGFSGVVCGLAGYVWIRQKVAPWEGYPLPKSTFLFLMIFVLGITVLQLISFVALFFHIADLPINIANSAHISGALFGMLLGRMSFFGRKRG